MAASSSVFNLTRYTALAAGDVIPAVQISDHTQSAHGSLNSLTIANFFGNIPSVIVVTNTTGPQITAAYDSTHKYTISVASSGNTTLNATGTLTITPALTLSAALTYGGVTLSNAVTGTGNMVLSASPTLTGTVTASAITMSGALAGATTGSFAASGAVTLHVERTENSAQSLLMLGGYRNGASKWFLGLNNGDSFVLWDATGSNQNFIMTSGGAASFNGSLSGITTLTTQVGASFGSNAMLVQSGGSMTGNHYTALTTTAAGTGYTMFTASANGSTVFNVFGNGNVTNTNNSYGAISDRRFKDNIADAQSAVAILDKIRFRSFDVVRGEDSHGQLIDVPVQHTHFGIVAQEVEPVAPWLIDTDKYGYKTARYSYLGVMAAMGVQELSQQMSALSSRLDRAGIPT